MAMIAHVPGNILKGNWTAAVYLDDKMSPQQEQALLGVYTGQKGGPIAELAKLVGKVVFVQKVPITFTVQGGNGMIKVGDAGFAELEPYKSASGDTTTLPTRSSRRCPVRRCSSARRAVTGRRTMPGLGKDLNLKGHNALQSTFVFDA